MQREKVDNIFVFIRKNVISFTAAVTKRFNDINIQAIIGRDEFPKILTAQFGVFAFVCGALLSIAAAVDGAYVGPSLAGAQDALRFLEVIQHALDLAAVALVGAGFDGHNIYNPIAFKFQIDAVRVVSNK